MNKSVYFTLFTTVLFVLLFVPFSFAIFPVSPVMKVAGLAVDIQKTFFPDGSLGVSGANSTAVVNFAKK